MGDYHTDIGNKLLELFANEPDGYELDLSHFGIDCTFDKLDDPAIVPVLILRLIGAAPILIWEDGSTLVQREDSLCSSFLVTNEVYVLEKLINDIEEITAKGKDSSLDLEAEVISGD